MTQADSPMLSFARVLSDGTRQRIMQTCCCCWCSVSEIVAAMEGEVSQPTVSHHLGVLRQAGLVETRKEGRQVFYTLDQSRIATCCGELLVSLAPETAAAEAMQKIGATNGRA